MKIRDIGSYLIVPARGEQPERFLREMKRLEWIFIIVRWLWVPIILVLAWLHEPEQSSLMMILGGVLGVINAVVCLLNIRIKTPRWQQVLGTVMLVIDTLLAWGIILIFARDFYTAAYAGFVYIIIEAAIRFGPTGSLSMAGLFFLALYGAFRYREAAFDVRFSVSGYVFWTVLMAIVALVVGAIVYEGKRQRALSENQLRENTLLVERQRMAHELHDTVVKTLQGLSLEARALGNREAVTPSIKDTAQYIEEVCDRTSLEIREVIFDLRNESAGKKIGEQISEMLNDWSGKTGIAGEMSISGRDVSLPPDSSRHVRHIVMEALTNVQRHASASRVDITLKTSDSELDIEISDNGRGIGWNMDELPDAVDKGKLGIAGMKERAELIGGQLFLDSDSSGTRIAVKVPVTKEFLKD